MIVLTNKQGVVALTRAKPVPALSLRKGKQPVVVSGGGPSPVSVIAKPVTLAIESSARTGRPGRDGIDGRNGIDGDARLPETIDGGNF